MTNTRTAISALKSATKRMTDAHETAQLHGAALAEQRAARVQAEATVRQADAIAGQAAEGG